MNIGSLTGSRTRDEMLANASAGLNRTPDGYTWHHHQDKGRMQLVESGVHNKTGHTGGHAFHQRALAAVGAILTGVSQASAEDWAGFAGEMMVPLLLSPSQMGNGSLYGEGTPFETYEDYEAFQGRMDIVIQQRQNEIEAYNQANE